MQAGNGNSQPLTLLQIAVWLQDPTERLRILAALSEVVNPHPALLQSPLRLPEKSLMHTTSPTQSTSELRGGELASAIHLRGRHGDPLVQVHSPENLL